MAFIIPTKDSNKIYHYCKLSTALEQILPNKRLLLNPIINTNDPRENKSFLFGYGCNGTTKAPQNILELNKKFSDILREDCKVLCFSQDYKNYQGCHLSKMWAQYGDNHKGLCLEINLEKFRQENLSIIKTEHFGKVKYLGYDFHRHPQPKQISLSHIETDGEKEYIINKFRKDNLEYLLFSKNDEWEAESEMRLVYFSNCIDKLEYCSIANSLESIHLGIDLHTSYFPSVKELSVGTEIYKKEFINGGLVSVEI